MSEFVQPKYLRTMILLVKRSKQSVSVFLKNIKKSSKEKISFDNGTQSVFQSNLLIFITLAVLSFNI